MREKQSQRNLNLQERQQYYIVLVCNVLFWELVMIITRVYCPVWKFSVASVVVFTVWRPEFSVDSECICYCLSVTHHDTWNLVQLGIFLSSRLHLRDSHHHNLHSCGGERAMPRVTVMEYVEGLALLQNTKNSNKYSKIWNILIKWLKHIACKASDGPYKFILTPVVCHHHRNVLHECKPGLGKVHWTNRQIPPGSCTGTERPSAHH